MINENGMSVKVTNYAASLTDVSVPDKQGNFEHVVLGFDSLKNYLGSIPNSALQSEDLPIELEMPNSV